jgi:hypothetical protein
MFINMSILLEVKVKGPGPRKEPETVVSKRSGFFTWGLIGLLHFILILRGLGGIYSPESF